MGYDPHSYHPNFNRIFHEINIQLMTSQAILYPWTPFKLMIQPPIKLMACSSMNQPPSVYGLFLHQLYHYIYIIIYIYIPNPSNEYPHIL
jgi:hypothetical protein